MEYESILPQEQTPYRVKMEFFEGPLDLLLYLIKKNELDICEVSLSKIADQYLQYVSTMQLLNLDIAGEFILVAATLMYLKSRALLPQETQGLDEQDEDLESPQELIRRLLEYKKYKDAAAEFKKRNSLYDTVYPRQLPEGFLDEFKQGNENLAVNLFDLVAALQRVLAQVPETEKVHEINPERVPIGVRIMEIFEMLRSKTDLLFEEVFADQKDRHEIIVTFLSVLEMSRLALVRIYQTEAFRTIRLQSRLSEMENPYERVRLLIDQKIDYRGEKTKPVEVPS